MSYNGTCKHNNIENYCLFCEQEKDQMDRNMMRGLGRLGKYGSMSGFGTMGIECKPGYYEAKIFGVPTGQCVPTSGALLDTALEAWTGAVATGVATSPATQAAAHGLISQALGDKILAFYKNQPVLAVGSTVVVGGLLVYGLMSFVRGR